MINSKPVGEVYTIEAPALKIESVRISKLFYHSFEDYKDIDITRASRYLRQAERIGKCCDIFVEYQNKITNERYKQIYFCGSRFCPICQSKQSLQLFKLVFDVVSSPEAKKYNFLFLTLTIRNCTADELSDVINQLQKGVTKLISNKRNRFVKSVRGYFKSLEITYNRNTKTYHPHIHMLLLVDKSYNKKSPDFLTKDKLIELWKRAINVDYEPSIDIRFTYNTQAQTVAEVAKYTVKSGEVQNSKVLQVLEKALYKRRLHTFQGDFRTLKNKVLEQWEKETTTINFYEIVGNPLYFKLIHRFNFAKNCYEVVRQDQTQKLGINKGALYIDSVGATLQDIQELKAL